MKPLKWMQLRHWWVTPPSRKNSRTFLPKLRHRWAINRPSANAHRTKQNTISSNVSSAAGQTNKPVTEILQNAANTPSQSNTIIIDDDNNNLTSDVITKSIVVSQLHPSITSNQVIQYMVKRLGLIGEHNITTRALIPKGKSPLELNFVSMLLDIPIGIYNSIKSTTLWPEGVSMRDFENRPRKPRPSGIFLQLWMPQIELSTHGQKENRLNASNNGHRCNILLLFITPPPPQHHTSNQM